MNVAVTRRFLKKDYFQQNSGGYFGGPTAISGRYLDAVRLSNITNRLVTYTFIKPFPELPVRYVSCYRFQLSENGDFEKTDVLHTYPLNLEPFKTFMLRISEFEALEGVIIDLIFT